MPAIALQSLPLGFRFYPKDEELVNHYLKNKITGRIKFEVEVIPEIDVCKCEPWELPAKSLIKSEDPEWFFFAPKDRKYPSGHRSNRATKHGYWKATGRDRIIRSSGGKGLVIGMKKTLVFHEGRAPKGVRTYWVMHEYRTTEPEFESGDEGSYVLYRLFNKKSEEKSPSSKTDDDLQEEPIQSPDAVEGIEIQSNHESPKSVLQEEPIQSPGSAKKQLADMEMWDADKGQCSTRAPVKPETDRCNMALLNEETKLGETADTLQDLLFQLCDGVDERVGHGFSNISSPMLQIPDNPSSSDMNQESHMGSDPFDDNDYLNTFLKSILVPDNCSSGACIFPEESPAESLVKQAPAWDSASCKDSGSNSEIEIEPCFTQGATSQRFHESSLGSSDLLQMDGSSLYPESPTQLSTVYENASLFPYGITGPDGYSVDAGAESMDELFNNIEEFDNLSKISVTTEEDSEMSGIKIRSPQSNNHEPPSSSSLLKQGIAKRRICLQSYIRVPSTGADADTESNHMVDDEDKNSIPKAAQTLSDSIEESSSDENITDKLNESMEIGIKIRDQEVQHSPNALSPQDKHSSNKSLLQSTSDSESQVGDNDTEEVENIVARNIFLHFMHLAYSRFFAVFILTDGVFSFLFYQQQHAGDPLGDKISKGKENTLPTSPNKLEEFPIHDADETSSSSNHQNPESMVKLRKKSEDGCDKSVKQSSNSMGLMNHSVVAHMIYLVLSVMVLLFASGIYRLAISTVE